jgi:hypothetical protein
MSKEAKIDGRVSARVGAERKVQFRTGLMQRHRTIQWALDQLVERFNADPTTTLAFLESADRNDTA